MEYSPTRNPTTATINRKMAARASTCSQSFNATTLPCASTPYKTSKDNTRTAVMLTRWIVSTWQEREKIYTQLKVAVRSVIIYLG